MLQQSLITILIGIFWTSFSLASSPKIYGNNMLMIGAEVNHFNAEANYLSSGNQYVSLLDGYSYHVTDFNLTTRWTRSLKWGMFVAAKLSSAESKSPTETRTNSGISELTLGTDFVLIDSSFLVVPEFYVTTPFKKADAESDDVLNSEGATVVSAQIYLKRTMGSFLLQANSGFIYRDGGRSSLVPYGAQLEWNIFGNIFGGGLDGFTTVGYDADSDNTTARETYFLTANGGSMRYYGINPDLIEGSFWFRKAFQKDYLFKIGAGHTVTGANTAAGWNVFIGINYTFPIANEYRDNLQPEVIAPATYKYMKKEPTKTDSERFKEDTEDGVDQNLFNKDPNFQPVSPEGPQPTPTPIPRKKLESSNSPTPAMQIKLKPQKKKKRNQ